MLHLLEVVLELGVKWELIQGRVMELFEKLKLEYLLRKQR
jgi:hypothetical protein